MVHFLKYSHIEQMLTNCMSNLSMMFVPMISVRMQCVRVCSASTYNAKNILRTFIHFSMEKTKQFRMY